MAMRDRQEDLRAEQHRRLLPSQQKQLTGDRIAIGMIDDYKKGFENFVKESNGSTLSDIFRGTIAKNKNVQKVDDLVSAKGRTPAEIELASKYNALIGNLRNLTNEVGVLTDADAVRILGSFDPAQDRKQVVANLDARRKSHERRFNTQLEDLQAIGKDVSKFIERRDKKADPQTSGAAAPTPQALPAGVPQGSKLIGKTAKGGMVYQTPEGKKLVAE